MIKMCYFFVQFFLNIFFTCLKLQMHFTVGHKWRDMSGDLDGSLTSGATGGDDSCTGEFPSAEVVRNFLHIQFACLCCHKCSF